MAKLSSAPNSADFISSIEKAKDIPLEKQLADQLKFSKNSSISEVQKNLERMFGDTAEEMAGENVQSLIESIKTRVNATLENTSKNMTNSAPDALSRQIWSIGGEKTKLQISNMSLSGINSLEIGDSYLEHLSIAKKHAAAEWESADTRNRDFLEKKAQVKPFLGMWDNASTMLANAEFLQQPFVKKAGLFGLGIGGTLFGAGLGRYLVDHFTFRGMEKVVTAIGTGFVAGSLPGALIGGGIGILGGVLLPKALAKIQKDHARKRKEKAAEQYEKFSETFRSELEKTFEKYEAIARKIRESGQDQAELRKDYIEAMIDTSSDTKKAELTNVLVNLKKDPSKDNFKRATKAFAIGRNDNTEAFQISFLEGVKKLTWIGDTVSIANQLEYRAAESKTFRESAMAQQKEFIQFLESKKVFTTFKTFKDIEEFKIGEKPAFAGIQALEKEITEEALIKEIMLDLNRSGKADDLLAKIKEEFTQSVGFPESTRVILLIDHLFNSDLFSDGSISIKTKQKILTWIKGKDTTSGTPIEEKEGNVVDDPLNRRLKDTLFKDFNERMDEKIVANWKNNDPFELLQKMIKKTGQVQIGLIDNADAMDQISLPTDLNKRETLSAFHITSNSNEKGIELEGMKGKKKLRIHLLGSMIKGEKTDGISRNARVYEIGANGKPEKAREALLTDVIFSNVSSELLLNA